MSTPEEPPQLTRRQLRELRNTAATPIITEAPSAPDSADAPEPIDADAASVATDTADGAESTDGAGTPPPPPAGDTPAAPLAREAEPVSLPEPPVEPDSEAEDDGEASPSLTRREIRQRERLRTASVPVITSEVLAATRVVDEPDTDSAGDDLGRDAAAVEADEVIEAEVITDGMPAVPADDVWSPPQEPTPTADKSWDAPPRPWSAPGDWSDTESRDADSAEAEPSDAPTTKEHALAEAPDADEAPAPAADATDAAADEDEQAPSSETTADTVADEAADASTQSEADRRVVAPTLGSDLLDGHAQGVEVPASFDQLLSRGATGALSMPNALILSQTPDGGSLTSPVTATGEILITGTFALPDRYGSTGTVPGRADGKEADAVLVDGELPAASSPTPIAASAAISTIKSADEIIKPPAPERGSRLMVVLAITAGVLAVALAGVLILAITTGIFS